MADPYWDPANLLQITGLDDSLEPQCVGRSARGRTNARCRSTLSPSNAGPVLLKIRKLAAIPPTKLAQQDLEALAKACLCNEHAPQWPQVVQRWRPILANAAKQHDRVLAAPNGNGPADRVRTETFLLERRKCCDVLGLKHDLGDLSAKLSAHLRIQDEARIKAEAAQSAAEEELQALKGELEQAKWEMAQLKDDLDRANAEACQPPACECQFPGSELDELRNAEAPRLAEMLKLVEAAKNDRNDLKTRIIALEKDCFSIAACLDAERNKSKALEHTRIELEEQLSTAAQKLASPDALLDEERAKTRALEEAKANLKRRLSEATTEMERAQSLALDEKTRTAASKSVQAEYHRRLNDAYLERDRLLAEEKTKARNDLRQTTCHFEQRLREVNTEAQRLLHKENTRAKVLAEIRTQLKVRLCEVRAAASAEAQRARREIEAVDKKHKAAANQVERLQSDLRKAKTRQSALERDLSESRNTAKNVQSLNDKLTTTNTALNQQLTLLQQQVTALKAKRWRPRFRSFFHPQHPNRRRSPSR
ncbi:hypothetical protein N658DRAFT_510977 [Parathielavia hyrcaniae]|uniref:Uncharacterized protein n=1 Tax=Parathielavia hyrcaniae TaxID=113614 RepID=A0AAN6PRT5_9PEZI|nr:hypothetical protein N658DRAFT_510977 [Parathielavia hyrcaniae]